MLQNWVKLGYLGLQSLPNFDCVGVVTFKDSQEFKIYFSPKWEIFVFEVVKIDEPS